MPSPNIAMSDGGPAQTMSFGVTGATFTSTDQSGAAAAVTDVPTSGLKLVITDIELSAGTTMTFTFTCETTGTVVAKYFVLANSTVIVTPRGKRKLATADKRLMVQTSVSGNIAVTPHYYSEL